MQRSWTWLGLLFGVAGIAIGSGWLADGLADWLECLFRDRYLLKASVGGLILFMASVGIFRLRHGFLLGNVRKLSSRSVRHHTLIMGLSIPTDGESDILGGLTLEETTWTKEDWISKRDSNNFDERYKNWENFLKRYGSGVKDKEGIPNYQPRWQQNLRMVWFHVRPKTDNAGCSLRRIYVVLSLDTSKNAARRSEDAQARGMVFEKLLKEKLEECCRRSIEIFIRPEPVDYENVDDVTKAINELVRKAQGAVRRESLLPWSRSGICIDVTSGTKTFSIAAAIAAMRPGLTVGYVDNRGDPKIFAGQIDVLSQFG